MRGGFRDVGAVSIGYGTYFTPRIIGVPRYGLCIVVNDSNYVALQVLDEIVGNVVVKNTANSVLIIVERNKRIAVPSLTKNLSAVKGI